MNDDPPLEFSKIQWIQQRLQTILKQRGYLEYDCPILEPIELYSQDSQLIQNQTYSFEDKSGQTVVLRPEMTPSFARLVSKFSLEISKPIRWFSIPKCYRYERPQKGRLREFRQLNVDLVGPSSLTGDIEILYLVESLLKSFGILDFVEIRYNHRELMNSLLGDKSSSERVAIFKKLDTGVLNWETIPEHLVSFFKKKNPLNIDQYLRKDFSPEFATYWNNLSTLLSKKPHFQFSPQTVRGIEYYTGIVFEVFPTDKNIFERAILGGGRYNNLLATFGGDFPCIGFGLGLHILQIFIEEVLSQQQRIYLGYPESLHAHYERYVVCFQPNNTDSIERSHIIGEILRKDNPESTVDINPIHKHSINKSIDIALKNGYDYVIVSDMDHGDDFNIKNPIEIKFYQWDLRNKIKEEFTRYNTT